MILKFIALSFFGLSSSTTFAGYLMIGPHEFKPETSTTGYSILADGLKTSAVDYVVAKVNVPMGSTIDGFWCQLYDASLSFSIRLS